MRSLCLCKRILFIIVSSCMYYATTCSDTLSEENCDISKIYTSSSDSCPFISGQHSFSWERFLFMVHTSNEKGTPSIAARCTIESAANHNPSWNILVFSNSWDVEAVESLGGNNNNVKVVSGWSMKELFSIVPEMLEWYMSNVWKDGYRYHHLSDALRLVILKVCGGLYMDTDIILLRSLSKLPGNGSFVGIEEKGDTLRLNNAVLGMYPHHPFADLLIKDFINKFDANRFGWNGPQLVSRVFQEQKDKHEKNIIHLAEPKSFYPVSWDSVHKLFDTEVSLSDLIKKDTYGVHLWHSLIKGQLDYIGSDSMNTPISNLFNENCPSVFKHEQATDSQANKDVVLRINEPIIGQQYHDESAPIPVSISIEVSKEFHQKYELDSALICLYVDDVSQASCLPLNTQNLQLEQVPIGHHVLFAEICIEKNSIADSDKIPHCTAKHTLARLSPRSVSSFTVGFHKYKVTVEED